MTSILLTGKDGQVGFELRRALAPLGKLVAPERGELDLADGGSIRSWVREARPAVIVNAGAYTAVDRAESEPELARAVNATAPGILAEEARRLGAVLVHYSTDYVFDGKKAGPYREEDPPAPLSQYGRSKLEGEQAIAAAGCPHLILRTSWVYGARGANFLLTMLRLAREREELRIVDDQVGAPTWSRDIAQATAAILAKISGLSSGDAAEWSGVYHLTAAGQTSWYGFAQAIFREAGALIPRIPRLIPVGTADYPLPARRPRNSVLSCAKVQARFGVARPAWQEALSQVMRELRNQGGSDRTGQD
ncbi:MAG TPA: dTDP-4-dehydrorhamnose reductase [Burkholderiales bacterium]|nr:dTDP-4-dehydrorhamnose reductase [Burkholderiales bacterium]